MADGAVGLRLDPRGTVFGRVPEAGQPAPGRDPVGLREEGLVSAGGCRMNSAGGGVGPGNRARGVVSQNRPGTGHDSHRRRLADIRGLVAGAEHRRGRQHARHGGHPDRQCQHLRPLQRGVRPAAVQEEPARLGGRGGGRGSLDRVLCIAPPADGPEATRRRPGMQRSGTHGSRGQPPSVGPAMSKPPSQVNVAPVM